MKTPPTRTRRQPAPLLSPAGEPPAAAVPHADDADATPVALLVWQECVRQADWRRAAIRQNLGDGWEDF
jgi:hypothetical protein